MWDHLSHARVLKLVKLVSMHNAYIYIYICMHAEQNEYFKDEEFKFEITRTKRLSECNASRI